MNTQRGQVGHAMTALIVTYCAHWFDMSYAGKVAPAIASTYGQPLEAMTYVFSGSRLGMAVGGIAGGLAGDRWGRKPILCVCLLLASLLALITPAAGNFWFFVVLRTLSGVMLGGAAPCALALAASVAPLRWRSLAITATLAGVSVGSALGSLMVYLLSDPGRWLITIPICGVALAAALLMVALWVPNITSPERQPAAAGHSAAPASLNATTWVLGVGFALTVGLNTIIVSWQPTYFHQMAGVAIQQFAGVAMFTTPAGIVGMVLIGLVAHRVPYPALLAMAFGGHAAALALLGSMEFTSSGFALVLAATAVGQAAAQAILNLAIVARYPAQWCGTAFGSAEAVARISGVIAPAAGAIALRSQSGLQGLFLLFSTVPIVVGTAMWILDISQRRRSGYSSSS